MVQELVGRCSGWYDDGIRRVCLLCLIIDTHISENGLSRKGETVTFWLYRRLAVLFIMCLVGKIFTSTEFSPSLRLLCSFTCYVYYGKNLGRCVGRCNHD